MSKSLPPAALPVLFALLGSMASAPVLAAAQSASPSPGAKSGGPGTSGSPDSNAAPAANPPSSSGGSLDASKETMVPDDASASRNAARTRMHECGHQWSTLKKTGGAAGLTWKEFSQGCLARK